MAKEKLYRKICFPYTAVVQVPSLVKHAIWEVVGTYVDSGILQIVHLSYDSI